MAKEKPMHQVLYKYKILGKIPEVVIQYYENANNADNEFSEFFLTIFGGITPQDLQYARYATKSKVERTEKDFEENKNPDFPTSFDDAIFLFFNWFTFEDLKGSNSILQVKSQDVILQFESYLKEFKYNIDPTWLKVLKATVISTSQKIKNKEVEGVWIDRKKGHALFLKEVPLSKETIAWFFKRPDFPLQEKGADGIAFSKDFISNNWGKGKKSDFSNAINNLTKIQNAYLEGVKKSQFPEQIRKDCCTVINASPSMEPKQINALIGVGGTPSGLAITLAQDAQDVDPNKWHKKINTVIKERFDKYNFRCDMPLDSHIETAKNYLINKIKLPFQQAFWSEFGSKALQRISSNRKNSANALVNCYLAYKYCENYEKEELTKVPIGLVDLINKWCKDREQNHIYSSDIKGFEELERLLKTNYIEAAKALRNSRNRRLNFNFIEIVAEWLDKNSFQGPFFELISKYQIYVKHKFDLIDLKNPRLARYTNSPNHPEWGEGRPSASYKDRRTTDNGKIVHNFTLDILTKDGIHQVVLETANNRADRNLMHTGNLEDCVQAARSTKLMKLTEEINHKDIYPTIDGKKFTIETNAGIKLFKKDDYYSLYVSYKLPSKNPKPLKVLQSLNRNWRFLAFDPGIRTNITFCVAEITEVSLTQERKPFYRDEVLYVPFCKDKWFRVLEDGALREKDFKRRDKNNMQYQVCRLESKQSANTPSQAIEFFEALKDIVVGNKALIAKDNICPTNMVSFIEVCIGNIRYYANQTKVPDTKLIKDFTQILKESGRNSGHLTYARIINLKNLKSLYQLYLKKNPEPWMEDSLKYVTEKIMNCRKERFRRITNLIAEKALTHRVQAVIMENTSLDIHTRSNRKLHKKVDIWTPKQVLAQCETQLTPLGIATSKVASDYSSHTDFFTGEMKTRWEYRSEYDIQKDLQYWADYAQSDKLSETYKVYVNQIGELLKEKGYSWDNWQECKFEACMFPVKGGSRFESSIGNINSDLNAALFFMRKGLERIANYGKSDSKPKKPRVPKTTFHRIRKRVAK